MSSSQSNMESSSGGNIDVEKSLKNGKEYEKLTLALLTKKAYELSIDENSHFCHFAVGREVGLGEDRKLNDIVFRYEEESIRNLIFVQIKHKEENKLKPLKINSRILSGSGSGRMNTEFNLREYFTSYLSIKDELKITRSKEFRNTNIKYVAIFTNIGLDREDLEKNGFILTEASNDVKKLFTLNKSISRAQENKHCHQLLKVSDIMYERLKKCSHLYRIAKEFARYVAWKKHSEKNIMKTDKAPIKYYHVALEKEVVEKLNPLKKQNNELYFVAKFKEDFIENNESGVKKQLLNEILRTVKELDKDLREKSDDELKDYLRETEWKVVPHFGDYLPKGNSSDLNKIAKEFANFITNENLRDKIIFGKRDSPITHYEVAFEREIIMISDQVDSFCKAKFRDDFINNEEIGPKQDLKQKIFSSIRESSKYKNASDNELKKLLRGVELKIDPYFCKAPKFKKNLRNEWTLITDVDITDFLKCLVFLVNQPNETDLISQIGSVKEVFLIGSHVGETLDKMDLKFVDQIKKASGTFKKDTNKETWIYDEEIKLFAERQQAAFIASVLTFKDESEIMQYGKFKKFRKLARCLSNFLLHKFMNVLCVCTVNTVLTTIKILHYVDSKKYRKRYGHIFIGQDKINSEMVTDIVQKAFRSEMHDILTIECGNAVNEQILKLYYTFSQIIKDNTDKKLILIINQNELDGLIEKIKLDLKGIYKNHKKHCDLQELCSEETDDIVLKDFEPKEDPLTKQVIIFQEQKEKISLATLTKISNWNNYVSHITSDAVQNVEGVIEETLLVEILKKDEIIVGSKPLGTDNLQGAYSSLFEEINKETLANRIMCKANDWAANDMYVVSGISGLDRDEKMSKLISYLGLTDEKKEEIEKFLVNTCTDNRVIFDFNDFKDICRKHSEKVIFWICVKDEKQFFLQRFYNPNFYLKRKFQKIVIKKKITALLTNESLSEIFIFSPVCDLIKLMESLGLTDDTEKRKIENNYRSSVIIFCISEEVAEMTFQKLSTGNETVHWLQFEENQLIWCGTHGFISNLRQFVDYKNADHKENEIVLVEENDLIKQIKFRKVMLFADDPGMGKTSTLAKLYESRCEGKSFLETHWVITVNLRDHLQAIRNIKLTNGNIDVVNFLTEVNSELNNSLTKNLLKMALNKSKYFLKPLILVFDGFDEVLDVEDRNKVMQLLKFLKEKTTAKIWITTRRQYKEILEEELSAFAIEFDPLNDESKKVYIKNYFKDRLCLILNEQTFFEVFHNEDGFQCSKNIQIYITEFLCKMKSIFKDNVSRFIGTPLQLYLMLENSIKNFNSWIKNDNYLNPDFSYLGNDLWEVFENFIDRKYDVYFQKVSIREHVRHIDCKCNFNRYNKKLAISLIVEEETETLNEELQDRVLSAGIIASQDRNIEFIHTTFQDFFVAKSCIEWIKSSSKKLSNSNKQKYLLKVIFKETNFQLVRTFINLKLKQCAKIESFEKCLKCFGIIMEKLLRKEESCLMDVEGTVLHIAAKEGNTHIARFLLNALKEHRDSLVKLLLSSDKHGSTPLHLACKGNDDIVKIVLDAVSGNSADREKDIVQKFLLIRDGDGETALHASCRGGMGETVKIVLHAMTHISKDAKIVLMEFLFAKNNRGETALHLACEGNDELKISLLLDVAAGVSEDALQGFLHSLDDFESNALDKAVIRSNNIRILEILLERTVNKLGLVVDKERKSSSLCNACKLGKREFVKALLRAFKHDENSLKLLLLHETRSGNVLCYAIWRHFSLRRQVDVQMEFPTIQYLLSTAQSINDNNETLKKLLIPENQYHQPLEKAVSIGSTFIVKILLNTAKHINDNYLTLKQMLLYYLQLGMPPLSSYNCSAVELLFETAEQIDDRIFQRLLCVVSGNGENEIEVEADENDLDKVFIKSVRIFKEEKYFSVRKKVVEIYKASPFSLFHQPLFHWLQFKMSLLVFAIAKNSIHGVREILTWAKCSEVKSQEKLRLLLLLEEKSKSETLKFGKFGFNTLHLACCNGCVSIVKELISCAMDMNDEGETLRKLIKSHDYRNKTPFDVIGPGHTNEIKEIIESVILQARNDNKGHIATILQEIQSYEEINVSELLNMQKLQPMEVIKM